MPGNLTALRELALRRTAQRVDAQMVDYMRAHAIQGHGKPASGCWSASASDPAPPRWCAMRGGWPTGCARPGRRSMSRPGTQRQSEAERDRVAEALRLAERLGGEAVTVPAASDADGVIQYAQANNITHIVDLDAQRPRWRELAAPLGCARDHPPRRRHQRACRAGTARRTCRKTSRSRARRGRTLHGARDFSAYVGSFGMVAAALAVGLAASAQSLGVSNVALVFLMAVLASAVTYGLWPSLFACFVCALAYNFFFLPPLYTFTIADPENVVTLFVFALVAVIASNLTARVRDAGDRGAPARRHHRRSLSLQPQAGRRRPRWTICSGRRPIRSRTMLKVRVVLLLPEGESVDGARRLSAGRHAGRARSGRRANGPWEHGQRGRARRRHAARRAAAVPAHAHRARRGRRHRAGQRPAGTAA